MSGHQTATIEDTVYFWFAANDTSGSGGDGATPLFDVREAGAAAGAIPLLSGTPTLLSHANYPAGCHEVAVAATAANGFAADDTFAVFCTLAIDSQNPSGFVGSCTLTPLAKAAALATLQTTADGIPTTAEFEARTLVAASYFDPAADAVATVTTLTNKTGFSLAATGLDAISQSATGMVEIAKAVWDRVLTGATHNIATSAGRRLRGIQEFQGYEDGSIWIDTVNGTAGTTDFENGTVENPVDSIADANTLAASLNINRFRVAPGSSITFAAAQTNQVFTGDSWTLALGGQSIVGSSIVGATVSGIAAGVGTTQFFFCCLLNAVTHRKGTHMITCGIAGTQTVGEAGDYFLDRCHSSVAGTSTWSWDFGAAIGNTNLNVRNYSGGIQLEAMGDTGTDTASIEGQGQVIEGTCTAGTVAVRGNFTVSGITNLTLSDDARIDTAQINAQADTALSDYDPPTNTEMEARTLPAAEIAQLTQNMDNCATGTASGTPTTTSMISDLGVTVDDQFNGRIVTFDDDTTTAALRKQSTDITGCTAASNTLTFTALTTAPVSGDKFTVT